MGFQFLNFINSQCDMLTSTVGPQIHDTGMRILFDLATIMLVWFGLQEAFASVRGGPGFDVGRFLSLFILMTFAFSFVKYFDTPIPGFDYSLKSYISQGTTALAQLIGLDSEHQMDTAINTALSKSGTGMRMFAEPYLFITYWFNQVCLVLLDVLLIVPIAYGQIAAAAIGILGPIFIPWMVFDQTEWLFWGWLKAYLNFQFYKVMAAAVMSIMANLFMHYNTNLVGVFQDPGASAKTFPFILALTVINGFILLKIGQMTASLFSGSAGGHGGGMGAMAGVISSKLLGML